MIFYFNLIKKNYYLSITKYIVLRKLRMLTENHLTTSLKVQAEIGCVSKIK